MAITTMPVPVLEAATTIVSLPDPATVVARHRQLSKELDLLQLEFENRGKEERIALDQLKNEIRATSQKELQWLASSPPGQMLIPDMLKKVVVEKEEMQLLKAEEDYARNQAILQQSYHDKRYAHLEKWRNMLFSANAIPLDAKPERNAASPASILLSRPPPTQVVENNNSVDTEVVSKAVCQTSVDEVTVLHVPSEGQAMRVILPERPALAPLRDISGNGQSSQVPNPDATADLEPAAGSSEEHATSQNRSDGSVLHQVQAQTDVQQTLAAQTLGVPERGGRDLPMTSERSIPIARPGPPSIEMERAVALVEDDSQHKRKADDESLFNQSIPKRPRVDGINDVIASRPITLQPRKTISFDEVYQSGEAQYKHWISEYPPGKNHFYILKCDEHGVHFNSNPLHGAAKHLHGAQHGHMSKERSQAVEHLGYLVFDCNTESMEKNNRAFKEAIVNGYKVFNLNQLSKGERKSMGFSIADTPVAKRVGEEVGSAQQFVQARPFSSTSSPRRPFTGITNPKPGEIYLGYWAQEKRNYAVLVLPVDDLKNAGLQGTLAQTGLLEPGNAPKCYVIDKAKMSIKGWAAGYGDGGHLVQKREFPVMYYDGQRSVGWLRARDLSRFDFEDPNWREIPYFQTAIDDYAQTRGYRGYEEMKGYLQDLRTCKFGI
ncbi:hypothetical protein B0T17DRAFT_347521 [Bombardia bombarda]|uniref:Uncharacterized protein n=1 Tax=Bombardia bombarda TaxID=252184 RepID=A0AA39WHN8_9PEZI|nr:hypothetical protein B0T17DRAFT_347521 [Bombardia bombarda]